jgi:hypothetical protein
VLFKMEKPDADEFSSIGGLEKLQNAVEKAGAKVISRLTNKVTHILMSDEFEAALFIKCVPPRAPPGRAPAAAAAPQSAPRSAAAPRAALRLCGPPSHSASPAPRRAAPVAPRGDKKDEPKHGEWIAEAPGKAADNCEMVSEKGESARPIPHWPSRAAAAHRRATPAARRHQEGRPLLGGGPPACAGATDEAAGRERRAGRKRARRCGHLA